MARGLSRRTLLQRAALTAVATPSVGAFLASCSSAGGALPGSKPTTTLKLASPKNPVTWPIADDNPAIADGATPEKNATLRLYNYADYIDPAAIKSFEKKYAKYGVKVTVSTFNDTDEALTKIRGGKVPFDIYFPSYDQISKMVTAKLIRPINHTFFPNIAQPLGVLPEPLVRPGLEVHRAVHRLHDGHRLAHRPGPRRHRRHDEPVRRLLGPQVQGQDRGHRRLAHGHGPGPAPGRR